MFFFFIKGGLERAHFGFFLSSKQTADPVVQVASGKENPAVSTVPATMPQPIVNSRDFRYDPTLSQVYIYNL